MAKWPLYYIISPSQRDLDYILIVSTTQSRDTMSNFATEQRLPLKLLIYQINFTLLQLRLII